ncbi:receptor-type tyrosine-protein phosphatase eta-like isoform X9 [Colossoma macropomum]|uniref:receptor-type tyrosine-protein phosphatase eta-like isoform X9 n=1 Tax=Colossoma macropomum TaxID=42526 RepID=UPI001863D695|nr:receptor-type tyrosine-protein phosphatase eta-like isoform X9 [Colossoma macropomum]
MRRYSFRWTVHGALLGLCVLLQSFSTTVPQSTVSTSAGQTSSGTSSTNSPAASTQGNIITTSAREETSSSTDSPTTSVTIEKTSTQGSGNTTTQNVMNGTVLSSPATSAREETSSSTDSPTTSVTIEKTSTQGSGNTNLNIINLRVTDRNTSSVSLAWNLLQANSDTGTQTNGIVSTSATTTVNNLTDGGNHTSTVTAVTADGSTTGLPVQTSAVTNSEKTKSLQPGYYKVEWTNETVSTTANTSNMSYTVTSLTAGMNYTFIVTAVAADGVTVGAPAQTSAFTKPDVVTNLNVSSRSTSSVSLTWNPPQGMNSYTVEWTDVNGSNKVNVSNTTYTVTNLTAGGKYTFIVTAVAADGVTAGAPTQISAFTNPDVVTNLNISDTSTSSVSLTWDPPQGNSSSYRIKWANGSVNVSNTSYTVTSLTAGVNYTFSVTTVAADGITSGASVQTSAFTKPDIVTNLTSNSTTTSVTLTWNLRQGGSSFYTVAWTSDVLHNVNTPDTSYTVTGLTAGVNYTFTVTAVAADNVTAGSPVQISAFTKPGTVTNLTVSDRSTSSVSLTWNLPQGNNSSYTVEWTDVNGSNKVNVSNTTYTVTNLTAGGKYTFIVTAVAADGVTAGAPTQISAFTKPDIVTNLTSNSTTTSVTLTWNLRQGGSSFYTVAWTSDVPYNRNTPDTSYTVTGLTAGVNYTFTVTAVAADNVTAGSPVQISAFTKPGAVTNLTVSDRSTSSVSLTWNLPQGNSSSYTVEWTDVNGSNKVNVSNTTYTVTNLTAGGKYTFIVTAVAADGVTAGAPTQISAFTKPDAVTNLTISDSNTSSVSLTWNSPQGNSSFYRVGWTDGNMYINATTSNTSYTVTNLTPGVNYTFSVTAVAGDGVTAGALVQTSTFTNPDVVSNLNVSDKNTSSVFLIWILQHGNSFFFRVEWTGGSATTSLTSYMATNLTAGMNYTFSVTAVAADGKTTGATTQISTFTKPDIIQNLTVIGVTTSSVLLNWFKPVGESSCYRVQYDNFNMTLNQTTQNTTINITDLIPGVQYMFRVFAVAADNSTEGNYGNISTYTKPDIVQKLTVVNVTTSSILLNWFKPVGESSYYRVQYDSLTKTLNRTTQNTMINITDLIPGVQYMFRVYAVAADNSTEGSYGNISSYTKPDIVQNLTVIGVTTSSVLLNWIKPVGESSYYRVQHDNFNMTLNQTTQNTTIKITDLIPGAQYMFRVFAVAADNSTEGNYGNISTYTKPEVIRNLTVPEITATSLFMNWTEPIGQRSFFKVQWTYDNETSNATTSQTFFNITNLIPGGYYYIRVSAVAADNKTEGEVVTRSPYTRPEIIRNLNAFQISTRNVSLNWTAPTGKSAFFRVLGLNESVIFNKTTKVTSFDITDLTPGLNFTFHVSAIAADNFTEGGVASLSVCTDASPVLTYSCEGPNHTDASLNITWMKPPGFCHGFNLSGTYISQNTCNRDCHHIISNLQYGMPYNVTITTLACGQSGIQNFVCTTGFTDPPVPTKPADLIFSPGSNQKRTVVQFSGSLLNGSKGEITAYGVLLSTDFDSNPNRTDLKNTYTDWTQKKSKSYLTVLKLNEKSMDRTEMIQIEIGTDETIQGTNYTNAPLEPNRYRVAVVLFTYLHISDGIVDTSLSFVSITPFATATIDIPNPLNIVGIVLGVLFFIIIILIIVIIVFIKLKRQRKKNDTGIPITTIRTKISIPVKVVDYEVYFKKQQADSNCGFAEEYEDLKVVGTAQNKSSALALENKGKNRYNNVLPYDSSRVKLSTHGSPFDDYINANYIAGYNSKKEYIAAQGPLPATVNEFWRMIWEKHVQTIVMLTKCNEQGRVKCEKYWPSGTKTYSNITVTNISEIALEDWTISDFTIRNVKTAESREVRHFHFTAWPDHGVPETTEVLINFRHLVREHMDQYSRHSPSVVHCSAGVGRTGTFIALDHLIFQIERESMVDIFGIVYDMRMHRPLMVQTEDQYVFLNQCAVDIIKSRMGTNVDLIYQNAAAFNVYGNVDQRWH